ncbi:MAG: Flp pilus assembly protein CpaB [Acidimicrobiales bacterium]
MAAIVALVSAVGLMRYAGGAEDRAEASVAPVSVMVAATDLAAGTPFDDALAEGKITFSTTLRSSLPATVVRDPASLQGTVADGMLRAGQTVVEGSFVAPDAVGRKAGPATFADALPEGTVAVSFDAAGSSAVSDLISPGDRVNLLVQVPNAAELGLPDSGGPAVVHVFQDLDVIAIGTAVRPEPGAEEAVANPGASTYTVAVAPKDAARLLFLTRQYEVLLALVGPGTKPSDQPAIGKVDALPDALTPAADLPQGATP